MPLQEWGISTAEAVFEQACRDTCCSDVVADPLHDRPVQPYLVAYGAAISTVSPTLTGWQLTKVYGRTVGISTLSRLGLTIFPQQVALKTLQMNAATPVKEYASPWVAFGLVGVLQGGVYGHCNVHFSRALQLASVVSLAGMFRGSAFAGLRDTISQGVPFMCSATVQSAVIDPLCECAYQSTQPAARHDVAQPSSTTTSEHARRFAAVFGTSICATFASQGAHNAQLIMQADHSLSYAQAVRTLWAEHGLRVLYMGGSARVALLLLVNGLNEVLLKPAWEAKAKAKQQQA
jgi:hypothetical protein